MKKTTIFSIALLSATTPFMAGCTSDEAIPEPDSTPVNEIRFAANTEFTRGGDITTNNLTSFNVYAYTNNPDGPKLFMDNVVVTKSSNNTWTYSPVKYWPSEQSLDFYAFSPSDWIGTSGPLSPVPFESYPGNKDIVYAFIPDLKGVAGQPNPQVTFNFRHALSKVTVKMSSTNKNLKVVVTNVAMANICSKGNFQFPKESTSSPSAAETVGKWTDQNTPYSYIMYMAQREDERLTLTTTPTAVELEGMGNGGALFMIPQPLTWRSNGQGNDTYLTVMGSIYDASTNTKLWPNENTPKENLVPSSTFGDGLIKFPLSTSYFSEWSPGCHYIYNLVINSNDEMGAIEFGTPTVESFIEVQTSYQ